MKNTRFQMLCGGFLAALVLICLLGAAAPSPLQHNQWTTNVQGEPIRGDYTITNSAAGGGGYHRRIANNGWYWYDANANEMFHIYPSGASSIAADFANGFGTFYTNGGAFFQNKNSGDIVLQIGGASGQTADLLALRNSAGGIVARVKSTGSIYGSTLGANLGVMTDSGTNLISLTVSNLTWASTVDINFNTGPYQYLIMTNNTTFTSSQLGAGKSVAVKIFAGTTNYTLTFPSWTFIGAGAPALLASNKTAVLSLTAWDGNTTNVIAAYAAQP